MRTTNPQRLLAYALVAIGVVMLLSRVGGADWLWLALLSGAFLFAYVSRKSYNFLVAGGVLMGIAVGTLIGTQSGMLLSLAAGFFAIDRIEPKPNRWALYSAGIFAVLGALSALGSFGLLGSVGFALVLIAAGVYLLNRSGTPEGSPDNGSPNADPDTSTDTPARAPSQTAPVPETETIRSGANTPEPVQIPAAPGGAQNETQAAQNQVVAEAQTAATEPGPTQAALEQKAEVRLKRLEAWRRNTAKTEGIPPYIVFSNDTLAKLAAANPHTLGELGTVRGVGPVKLSRYGETVLDVLRGDPNSDPKPVTS